MVTENEKALSHVKEMVTRTRCHTPVQRVVRVKDVTSEPNLEYFPACTIVYQCSQEAGCCGETAECVPKAKSSITRHFYVSLQQTLLCKSPPDTSM